MASRPAVGVRVKEQFLAALRLGASVTKAAETTGRARQRFYEARERDPAFAEAWHDAWEAGTDLIEDELHRRAVDGWDEAVYQKGEFAGYVRKYDGKLLELLLKARRPKMYSERLQVTGSDGGPVQFVDRSGTLAEARQVFVDLGIDPVQVLAGMVQTAETNASGPDRSRELAVWTQLAALPAGDVIEQEAVEVDADA